jgi:aldehyde dehydrogenase (NAD+)
MDMGSPLVKTRAAKAFTSQMILFFASHCAAGGVETLRNNLPGQFTTLRIKAPIGVVGGTSRGTRR